MRRITPLACALAMLVLGACHSTPPAVTAAAQQSPALTGNLCERLQSALSGSWKADEYAVDLGVPMTDRCALVDPAEPSHLIRVQVSVLPVTAEQFAKSREHDAALLKTYSTAKVLDGGIGAGSWAIDSGMLPPWLVFRQDDHQIRLTMKNDTFGTLDELRSIAHTVVGLPGGLPAVPAVVARPECTRRTAAAERLLGAKVLVRRDGLVGRTQSCQWGSATRVVSVVSGDSGTDPAAAFAALKDPHNNKEQPTHRVNVGAEAWQEQNGRLVFRSPNQTFVDITSAPSTTMRPAPILTFAQAIAPTYP